MASLPNIIGWAVSATAHLGLNSETFTSQISDGSKKRTAIGMHSVGVLAFQVPGHAVADRSRFNNSRQG